MRLADLNALPPALAERLGEAKEGLVDALLNLTWQRCSGDGAEGEFVFGRKPSLHFVSGFLLPRYEDTGAIDETSDIHVSTHGIDCQIAKGAIGLLEVSLSFAIYVRAMPTWVELTRPELDLFPRHSLKKEVEEELRGKMKERLVQAKADEESKPIETRRQHRELQQGIYQSLLGEHGVRISRDAVVVDSSIAPDADLQDGERVEGTASGDQPETAAALHAERGRYIFDRDDAAQTTDMPQKWQRLSVVVLPLSVDLSDPSTVGQRSIEWSNQLAATVQSTVATWLQNEAGQARAYRPMAVKPSDVSSEAAWERLLVTARQQRPGPSDIGPDLKGLQLRIQLDPDLRDATRRNLRVILENNSRDVGKRKRHRFEHAMHQVKLSIALPAQCHRPLRLDRVEASYRFRDFLNYPAIGINCGVIERRDGERLELATTWMPRYQQPRIVPNRVEGVPTDFESLARSGFDPSTLRPLVAAYETWIAAQETRVNPTLGVDNAEGAARERAVFVEDIANYRREAARIGLGIALLETSYKAFRERKDDQAGAPYSAWILLNRTFEEAGRERGVSGWRLFQLAFILAHIPTLASRMPEFSAAPWFEATFDEETATLLYFPTGGGKSEAFFGLLVFNLFLDRLRGKAIGVTALIRYPLRLLTLQQAQRLLSLLVRAELLRVRERIPGAPFEIGFWVGSGNTPNKSDDDRLKPVPHLDESPRHDSDATAEYHEVNGSFNKIPVCTMCSESTGLRRIRGGMDEEIGIFCFNADCAWNRETADRPLPFLIIDRDIYRHAPSVLLGVIDKLALIGQHPATINRVIGMFGLARWRETATGRLVVPPRRLLKDGPLSHECEAIAPAYSSGREVFVDPFPSLIIQDEAHLLEESLGTFAGLFETTLEQLLLHISTLLGTRVARRSDTNQPRLPKVVAATATVSVPQQQFGALYQRRHMHFPSPGTSLYGSFYSAPATASRPARRGIGGDGPKAPEVEAPWMRTYASLLTNGHNHTGTTVAVLAAYHLAITELWQDLLDESGRDGAVTRIVSALSTGTILAPFHEEALRTCASGDPEILPTLVDLMRISLTYVTNKKGGDQVIDALREEVAKVHRRHGRVISQLDTRLISGGVDVAQIQEVMRAAEGTARAGDPFPALETSLRNIVATSAISHGVDVDKFNAMFFAGMPSDIAEFIQASSRVGRSHVGFSLLIPTPQARRDRYIVETHDVFHRFLERMVAPPAITRWATAAHDRILTSVFQAWLCGWAEQRLFIGQSDDTKERAPIFETLNDVNGLLTSKTWPTAASDFMEFAVLAIGVPGRGQAHIGGAPHPAFYDDRIRNRAKELTDELSVQRTTTRLGDYWPGAPVGSPPMMSLRDIDEAGRFVGARPFGSKTKHDDEKQLLNKALRIVRRQTGRVSELDSEEGEG